MDVIKKVFAWLKDPFGSKHDAKETAVNKKLLLQSLKRITHLETYERCLRKLRGGSCESCQCVFIYEMAEHGISANGDEFPYLDFCEDAKRYANQVFGAQIAAAREELKKR